MSGTPNTPDELDAAVAERFAEVQQRVLVASDGNAELIVVTKGHPAAVARAALAAGATVLGESYAPELVAKAPEVPDATWHFIGQLQTNKVRKVAPHVAMYQSVDRLSLVAEIAKRDPGADVLLQVALDDRGGRGGVAFAELDALCEGAASAGLSVRGLMAIAPNVDVDARGPYFAKVRAAVDERQMEHCSIGMSDDYELAIAHGATMVRIGSSICGPRLD